jgi:3-deoxy-7-phosphoheptulonate synthase/chorismate mutase
MTPLTDLRSKVEAKTDELLRVVAERIELVREVAATKKAAGLPPRDLLREQALHETMRSNGYRPLTPDGVSTVLQTVIDLGVGAAFGSKPGAPILRGSGDLVDACGIGQHKPFAWIAGPCSVESEEGLDQVAESLAEQGVTHLRGGAWKPRTSPASFQGHGQSALEALRRVADKHGMLVVTEATGLGNLDQVADLADVIQVGSRNGQSYDFLLAVGAVALERGRSVLLKRGYGCTVSEWLSAAEYVAQSTDRIILCERGIRTFSQSSRFTLDLAGAIVARRMTRLPVCIDVSHAAGRRDLVAPLAAAAIACGVDSVMVEVHQDPDAALSDSGQQLTPDKLAEFVSRFTAMARCAE